MKYIIKIIETQRKRQFQQCGSGRPHAEGNNLQLLRNVACAILGGVLKKGGWIKL